MPLEEFVSRCKATPDVTEEQALVVYHNLWRMHVVKEPTEEQNSSAVSPSMKDIPFLERLTSGLVVRLRPNNGGSSEEKGSLVMILSRAEKNLDQQTYVCAKVQPAPFRNGYSLYIWQQVEVNVMDMQEEVILEYDEATRYYFLAI
jgi:kinesin family protein 2/24